MSTKNSQENRPIDPAAITFSELFGESIDNGNFVRMVLSKPIHGEVKKIIISPFQIRGEMMLSFDSRYENKSITKSKNLRDATREIVEYIGTEFKVATLFSLESDQTFCINKKGKARISKSKPTMSREQSLSHNKKKNYLIKSDSDFLKELKIANSEGKIIPRMYSKYRQISKFVEIVDHSVRQAGFEHKPSITFLDVGSGKGYLTFAVFEYLSKQWPDVVNGVGIDTKKEMIDLCNNICSKLGLSKLEFKNQKIEHLQPKMNDIVIALHACDTATDHAIFQGIASNSALIFVAPCCQHEIASQIRVSKPNIALVEKGLFLEKQAALITDVSRTLLLESFGYKVKVNEFVGSEHTKKNTLIVAEKRGIKKKESIAKFQDLKRLFGFSNHTLEKLLEDCSLLRD